MQRQRLQRLARMIAGDDNPLRRHVDKLESAVITSVVVAFLLVGPLLCIYVGVLAHASSVREQRTENGWTQQQAVLEQSAAAGMIDQNGEWDTSWVQARWPSPSGGTRTGIIAVPLNARAGQRTPVWVTATGQLTHAPLTSADIGERTMLAVSGAAVGFAALLVAVALTLHVMTNRLRMAAWARDWEATGPRWSSLR